MAVSISALPKPMMCVDRNNQPGPALDPSRPRAQCCGVQIAAADAWQLKSRNDLINFFPIRS